MAFGMGCLPLNGFTTMITWQDMTVWAVAVVVFVLLVVRVWRFFKCRGTTACDLCDKECDHRRVK